MSTAMNNVTSASLYESTLADALKKVHGDPTTTIHMHCTIGSLYAGGSGTTTSAALMGMVDNGLNQLIRETVSSIEILSTGVRAFIAWGSSALLKCLGEGASELGYKVYMVTEKTSERPVRTLLQSEKIERIWPAEITGIVIRVEDEDGSRNGEIHLHIDPEHPETFTGYSVYLTDLNIPQLSFQTYAKTWKELVLRTQFEVLQKYIDIEM